MQLDHYLRADLDEVPGVAHELEAMGFDGLYTAEGPHEPFLPLMVAAEHTTRATLFTNIAVAFARSPLDLAQMANDLQTASSGRFVLGVGSQIRPHIQHRFSMPWGHPVQQMRDLVGAIKAIQRAWHDRARLEFRSEHYTHTLMTPFFSPGPNPYGAPKVFLAAVGELMTEVAGEVADGLLIHGFSTEQYVREKTMPALARGMEKGGRSRESLQVSYPGFVITGNEDEREVASKMVKAQIAFYGSTPAYRPVLELHGWGDLQPELNGLSKRGEWATMAGLIDDDVLDAFAVTAEPADVAGRVRERFGDVIDRFSFYAPYHLEPETWAEVLAGFRR